MSEMLRAEFGLILPELFVAATIMCVLLSELLFGGDDEYEELRVSDFVALIGLLVALAVTLLGFRSSMETAQQIRIIFGSTLSVDPFSQFTKILLLLSTLFAVLFSYQTPEVTTPRRAEYIAYLLGLLVGGMFLASANDILMLYLAFETVGVTSYILAGHAKGSLRSSEAGFKYVLYGAAASGVLLYGLTYLYGIAGTTTLTSDGTGVDIFSTLGRYAARDLFGGGVTGGPMLRQLTISMIPIPVFMVLGGLLYKVAVFPFHFWAPDVYEGAPMPVTAIFSVLVKIAGFAIFIRFAYGYCFGITAAVQAMTDHAGAVGFSALSTILGLMAAATMTIGNLSALVQTNVKRLFAYSGIANAGYLLMGASVLPMWSETGGYAVDGIFAVLFFLAVYLFANLGAFVVAIAIADHLGKEDIEDYAGLGKVVPILGLSMAVFVFSLVGLPPLAGFVGKFYLFYAVIKSQMYWLAIIGVLNTTVSVFYYMRILRQMFLADAPKGLVFEISTHYKAVLWMLMIPVLVLGVYFSPLSDVAKVAAAIFVKP